MELGVASTVEREFDWVRGRYWPKIGAKEVRLVKKLLLISAAVLLMFAVLAPASAAPNGPPNGFILQDTDAAYAAFDDGDGCDVFVGYVRTDRLKSARPARRGSNPIPTLR